MVKTNQVTKDICVAVTEDEETYHRFCRVVEENDRDLRTAVDNFFDKKFEGVEYNVIAMMLFGIPIGIENF